MKTICQKNSLMNDYKRILTLAITAILITFIVACRGAVNEEKTVARSAADRGVPRVCGDRRPQPLAEGSYGMQPDGTFRFPALAPLLGEERRTFPGLLKEWDVNSYIKNMKVEAAYEGPDFTPDPFHTWQNIVDFDGRRYLFLYDREAARVFDITDVKKMTLVESLDKKDWKPGDFWGASSIQWNKQLGKYIMVQSFEQKRQVRELEDLPPKDKFNNPQGVAAVRAKPQLKGFKIYELNGPRRKDWKLLAAVSTDSTQKDPLQSDYERQPQQGSGSLDAPYYIGDKYLFIAVAPNDAWGATEYPTYLYSAGYQAWDLSDPSRPKLLGDWHFKGQIEGEEEDYRKNPRCGNRTSWMGARMPIFFPKPVEQGGKIGFAALGGFGLSALDVSDPARLKEIGHLDLPPAYSGTEGDNVDVSQYEKTGYVYVSGYPLNGDCAEPYKEIYQIDARDPKNMRIAGTLPQPKPPANAKFTSFCQRGGSFGPKRSGYYTSPGDPAPGLLTYAFYNAGVQIFDLKNPAQPEIAAYFVPKTYGKDTPEYAYGNQTHGVYIEWDRKIIWTFTNHGIYALSAEKLIGAPNLGAPKEPFRNSAL